MPLVCGCTYVPSTRVTQPISEWLAKLSNRRMAKWRDITISCTACHCTTSVPQYCQLLWHLTICRLSFAFWPTILISAVTGAC